ncbi:sodium:solute symporter family protein [Haliea sp. E1-2-M8]|uniref:sodium:solute symporter family protein n=1 Tax=Haliea sp. E1-2-M8 TaxID=3064706 RepID=UPI0027241EAA|nr:sodium:solute symporter family protein [Haliea sp. E1-2-M8]MDO8863936.1 sodium:solute symporter family protein [Haliea sp. E1-2-M8]
MNPVLTLVLVYNVAVIGGIGCYLAWREKVSGNLTDLATGGRNAGLAMLSVTLAITYLGSAHVYGLMEMSFGLGAVALWFCFAHTILICVICLGTGPWVRRLGCATIPELVGRMYGPKMRSYVACIAAMVVFGLVTLETQTLGIGISAISGWSLGWSAVLGAVLGTAYVTFGGIKQTMWVNLVNAVVMYASIIMAGIYLGFVLPEGWEGVREHYVVSGEAYKLSVFGTPDLMVGFALAAVFSVVFSQSVNQQGMAAAISAKNETVIRRSLWIAAPINGLFGVFPVLCGLAAATIPEFAQLGPKLAAATMVVQLLPTWLVVLLQAGFLGALLSTFAMSALAPATIFTKDIVGANIEGGLSLSQEHRLIQRVILIVGALAAALTFFNHPNVISAITWLFAWLAPLFFVIVAGLFWKRSTAAAFVVVFGAWLVNCAWSIGPLRHVIASAMPALAPLENAHISVVFAFTSTIVCFGLAKNTKPALFAGTHPEVPQMRTSP